MSVDLSRQMEKMDINWDEKGLIPAIIRDDDNRDVLMLAYMNKESLAISLKEERTCFWSRSRQTLWRKGETSGHVQKIKSVYLDCDRDTLLVNVEQEGPACHEGFRSCFFKPVQMGESSITP